MSVCLSICGRSSCGLNTALQVSPEKDINTLVHLKLPLIILYPSIQPFTLLPAWIDAASADDDDNNDSPPGMKFSALIRDNSIVRQAHLHSLGGQRCFWSSSALDVHRSHPVNRNSISSQIQCSLHAITTRLIATVLEYRR